MISQALERQGFQLDKSIVDLLERFATQLLSERKKMNLIAVSDYHEVVVRHFIDSLMPLIRGWNTPTGKACDVGTGAGFPGLALALARPNTKWLLVESINKKISWLERILEELKIDRVGVLSRRAEEIGRDSAYRETFDLCVTRALAPSAVMLEFALPLVRPGGELWAWQGEKYCKDSWLNALQVLGGEVVEELEYRLPEKTTRKRFIVRVAKRFSTQARYPRRVGIPRKRPL